MEIEYATVPYARRLRNLSEAAGYLRQISKWIWEHRKLSLSVAAFLIVAGLGIKTAEKPRTILSVEHVPKIFEESGMTAAAWAEAAKASYERTNPGADGREQPGYDPEPEYLEVEGGGRDGGSKMGKVQLETAQPAETEDFDWIEPTPRNAELKLSEDKLPDLSLPFTGFSLQALVDLLRYLVNNTPTTINVNIFQEGQAGNSLTGSQSPPSLRIQYQIEYSIPSHLHLWHKPGTNRFQGTVIGDGYQDVCKKIGWLVAAAIDARASEAEADPERAINSGEAFTFLKQTENAEKMWQTARGRTHAALELARMYRHRQPADYKKAQESYEEVTKLTKTDGKLVDLNTDGLYALDEWGTLLTKLAPSQEDHQQAIDEAKEKYRQAIQEQNKQDKLGRHVVCGAYYHLGLLYANEGWKEQAEKKFNAQIKMKEQIEADNMAHRTARINANTFASLSYLQLANLKTDDPQLWSKQLGGSETQIIEDYYAKAISGLQTAMTASQSNQLWRYRRTALANYASVLSKLDNNFDLAIEQYEKMIDLASEYAKAYRGPRIIGLVPKYAEPYKRWDDLVSHKKVRNPRKRKLAMAYEQWGDLLRSEGEIDEAASRYCKAFEIDHTNTDFQRYQHLCTSSPLGPSVPDTSTSTAGPKIRSYSVELNLARTFTKTSGVLLIDPHGVRFSEAKTGKTSFQGSWGEVSGLRQENRKDHAELWFKCKEQQLHFQMSPKAKNLLFFEQTFYPAMLRWFQAKSH